MSDTIDALRAVTHRKTVQLPAAAIVLALLVALPWLTDTYTMVLATQSLVFGVLAISVGVLTGHAGLPTLGQVAPYAVGAYTSGWMAREGTTTALAHVVAAAAAGAAIALVTGLVVTRTRDVVVLMLTLAVGELVATAAAQWKSVTGGTDGLFDIPPMRVLPGTPELITDRSVYWYVLGVAVVVAAVTMAVLRSPVGLLLSGTRENEPRMRASGHPVDRYLLAAYVGAGAIAGIGGALLITYQRYVSPADIGFDVSALALLAVVVGGLRSVPGALAGAALIVYTRDWLGGKWPGHAPLLLGVLFVVAVYLLPDGAAGVGRQLRQLALWARRFAPKKAEAR